MQTLFRSIRSASLIAKYTLWLYLITTGRVVDTSCVPVLICDAQFGEIKDLLSVQAR